MSASDKRPYEVDAAFGRELRELLNRHSVENASDTPDFVLAAYLLGCLEAFECAMHLRDTWNELGKGS